MDDLDISGRTQNPGMKGTMLAGTVSLANEHKWPLNGHISEGTLIRGVPQKMLT
jgi:hypothetical protein